MNIGLIKGAKGLKYIGGGVNYSIIRLYKEIRKKHKVRLIYGNGILPKTLGYLPFGKINGFDILHAGAPEFLAFIKSKSPIISTFYDDGMCNSSLVSYLNNVPRTSDRLMIKMNKKLLKFLITKGIKRCKKIAVISYASKQKLINNFKVAENKIAIIPPGIDTNTFHPFKIKSKHENTLQLFFCGGISYRKGVDNLLKAVKQLEKEGPVKLWLAGGIHPSFKLKRMLINLKLTNIVKYFGFVSNKKLNQLYNKSDIFVMPSRFEGYGIPPLEALACGTKVVCSLMPSIEPFKEFVTITELTPKAIAENVLKAYKKKTDLKPARAKIEKEYSVKVVSQKYIKLYEKLVNQ